jgi:hypothetical protein
MAERPILFSTLMVEALLGGQKTQTRREVKNLPPPPANSIHPSHERRHPAPYPDAYCNANRTLENPRGKSDLWCWWTADDRMGKEFRCPYGQPGDFLWVRESLYIWGRWRKDGLNKRGLPRWRFEECGQRADPAPAPELIGTLAERHIEKFWLRPSIYMPRWASRIRLRIADVRMERLQDISELDAKAEGVPPSWLNEDDNQTVHYRQPPTWRRGFARLWWEINGPASWNSNPYVWAIDFVRMTPELRSEEIIRHGRE